MVGSDGETHQGAYDISFLNHIPNMTILNPKNKTELKEMLRFSLKHNGPVAIRYPRGNAYDGLQEFQEPMLYGKSECIYKEADIAILSVGHMMETAEEVYQLLKSKGYACSLINARFVKPLDTDILKELAENHKVYVTIEDGAMCGGYGANVTEYVFHNNLNVKVLVHGIPDRYIEHGSIDKLRKTIGLDATSIVTDIEQAWEQMKH